MKVSIDQKVTGADGYADWVQDWSEEYGLTPQIDTCLLGGGMFPGYEAYWTAIQTEPTKPLPMTEKFPTAGEIEWAKKIPELPHYVLSKTLDATSWPNAKFIRSLEDVAALKAQPGKDIYLVGGGKFSTELIDAGLVDELRLIVYPLIAGGNNTLFSTTERRQNAVLGDVRSLGDGRLRLDYRFI